MKCPSCASDITDGSRVHIQCGWRESNKDDKGGPQRRRAEFDRLAPCYRCGGTGIDAGPKTKIKQSEWMARRKNSRAPFDNPEDPENPFDVPNPYESTGVIACPCERGRWMSGHSVMFRALTLVSGG